MHARRAASGTLMAVLRYSKETFSVALLGSDLFCRLDIYELMERSRS